MFSSHFPPNFYFINKSFISENRLKMQFSIKEKEPWLQQPGQVLTWPWTIFLELSTQSLLEYFKLGLFQIFFKLKGIWNMEPILILKRPNLKDRL